MTMTTSDIISELSDSDEDLNKLVFIIIKHWDIKQWADGKFDEQIYASNFDQFVDLMFDLDIHGWELSGFNKSKYPRCPNSYSFFVGNVYAEFSRRGY